MLNRTNRTLSANLNRLNLGTRSLAAPANVNTGDLQALRIRHAHRVVMRDGMHGFSPPSIPMRSEAIAVIPGSLPVSSWLVASRVVRSGVGLAAETSSVTDRPCWSARSQDQAPGRVLPRQERPKRDRKPVTGKRLHAGCGLGYSPARAALATAAALHAAAGG
jgi:hypothetical protein